MHIIATGPVIHGDFFSVEGSDIRGDSAIEFATAFGVFQVTPRFVSTHLAFAESLPASIPAGPATLRLSSASRPASNNISVMVMAAAPPCVRVLQSGGSVARPYVIAIVANPVIEAPDGTLRADPVLRNRPGYHSVISHALHNLFKDAGALPCQNNSHVRIVSIFPPAMPLVSANALAHEIPDGNTMETRPAVIPAFLANYQVQADMVFVVHGSATHTCATQPSVAGTRSTTLSMSMPANRLSTLQQTGHAAKM